MGRYAARADYPVTDRRAKRTPSSKRTPYERALVHAYAAERRQLQRAAITALSNLNLEVDPPEYDHTPTASRRTTNDTHHTPKENPMPALHNRALALKLAVENFNDECYLIDDDGVIDEEIVPGVLALAERFVTFLGADEPATDVPSGDIATEAPRRPALRTTGQAIAAITAIIENQASVYGRATVNSALSYLPRLNQAANYAGALNAAVIQLTEHGDDLFGARFSEAVIAEIEQLQRA